MNRRGLALLAAMFSPLAMASGGHWLVDDAAIFPRGTFAIETWYEDLADGNVFMAQPAHTFSNGVETTLVLEFPNRGLQRFGVEAKGLWRDIDAGDAFGFGWVAGTRHDRSGSLEETFFYLPATVESRTGLWRGHVNIGIAREHLDERRNLLFAGVSNQLALTDSVELIAEFWSSNQSERLVQAGFRFALGDLPGVIDISHGRELNAPRERWTTIGLGWEF